MHVTYATAVFTGILATGLAMNADPGMRTVVQRSEHLVRKPTQVVNSVSRENSDLPIPPIRDRRDGDHREMYTNPSAIGCETNTFLSPNPGRCPPGVLRR